MKNTKMLGAVLAMVLGASLSSCANAGTWSSPVYDWETQVTSTQNLASVAGTSATSQTSGSCVTGQAFTYYVTSNWLYRAGVGRGKLTVYRQTCI
jgi:uncharacterized protein involved in tolerance to divalent cations